MVQNQQFLRAEVTKNCNPINELQGINKTGGQIYTKSKLNKYNRHYEFTPPLPMLLLTI